MSDPHRSGRTRLFSAASAPSIVGAALLSASLLSASPAWAQQAADEPSAGAKAVDLVIVRPVALTATVAGCGLFVLALPLNLIQWSSPKDNANALCVGPGKYTFTRPLGEE